jgi:hypothetical protein
MTQRRVSVGPTLIVLLQPAAIRAGDPVEANVSSPTAVHFGPIGPQQPFENDDLAEDAGVTFKSARRLSAINGGRCRKLAAC